MSVIEGLDIGDLRYRVMIQERVMTANAYGERVPTWQDVAEVWASVTPLAADKQFGSAADTTNRVTMRYYAGLTPKHRLIFDGGPLFIRELTNPDKRRRWHTMVTVNEET